jgi:hypothetical protein
MDSRPDNILIEGSDEKFDPKQDPCECAWSLHENLTEGPDVCASKKTIEVIADHLKIDCKDPEEIIEAAKEKVKCDTEKGVLEYLSENVPDSEKNIIERDLKTRYKMEGPADSTALFNNVHIDKTLSDWEKLYPEFRHVPFQFVDFREKNTILETLDVKRLYDIGVKTVGCVINTDYSNGVGGKHWVCVFIDMRNPEEFIIEFFNSSGRPPVYNGNAIMNWMCKIKRDMELMGHKATIKTNSLMHQQSNTECGPFCMYFLFNRIIGVPFEDFSTKRIPDQIVTDFRKHLFT